MRITILNGTPEKGYEDFSEKLYHYTQEISKKNDVTTIDIKSLNLALCNGCFNCWWKIPGKCNIRDDIDQVSEAIISAEKVIFAAPLIHSFPSTLLKKVQDRLIPLLLPYIELIEGECHHKKRYDRYPEIELYFGKEPDTNSIDEEIVTDIYKRTAINFHSQITQVNFV